MGTTGERNGYRMDTEQKWNGYGIVTDKNMKKCSLECKQQENMFFRLLASKLCYQSAYQRFGSDATLNTRSSNFVSPAVLRKSQNKSYCDLFCVFLPVLSTCILSASLCSFRIHHKQSS